MSFASTRSTAPTRASVRDGADPAPAASARERFLESLLESVTEYAVVSLDPGGLVTSWNEGARQLLGWTEAEMLGRSAAAFFTPEDNQAGILASEMQGALGGERVADDRWMQRKDASRFFAHGSLMAMRDSDGGALGFVKVLRDRTPEHLATERRLADGEFLASILASSVDCIKVLDLQARIVFMNDGGQRVMEIDDFGVIQGRPWPDLWDGDTRSLATNAAATAKAGGTARFQGIAPTMAGTPKWWDVQVTPIRGPEGLPAKLLVVSRDITDRKRAEERQRLLMQELAHRVKNTLAVVQAIASQTLRGEGSLSEARQSFTARLLALAHAHDVLLQGSWTEAKLRCLVDGAVRLLGQDEPGRFRIDGDDVTLGPRAALSFALVLHELGTNAVKYGALASPDGHVEASWHQDASADEPCLRFLWREVGGPPVSPPQRQGFGSRLIERSLTQGLGATVQLDYRPDGVAFTMAAPLATLQQR